MLDSICGGNCECFLRQEEEKNINVTHICSHQPQQEECCGYLHNGSFCTVRNSKRERKRKSMKNKALEAERDTGRDGRCELVSLVYVQKLFQANTVYFK